MKYLREMLYLILTENSFQFCGSNCLQNHGTAIGTKSPKEERMKNGKERYQCKSAFLNAFLNVFDLAYLWPVKLVRDENKAFWSGET